MKIKMNLFWITFCVALAPIVNGANFDKLDADALVAGAMEKFPHLKAYSSLLFARGDPGDRKMSFTDSQLTQMRNIFRYDPMKTSSFGRLVNGESAPDTRELEQVSVAWLVRRLAEKPEVANDFITRLRAAGEPREENEDEDPNYASCEKDYGAFVKPITNGLVKALCDPLCNEILGDPFVCGLLCSVLPEPPESQPWSFTMIDAMAKIPEGIGEGKLHWPGAYEYCNDFNVIYNLSGVQVEKRSFSGQYCRLDLSLGDIDIPLQFGVCVPDTCSPDHVKRFIEEDILLGIVVSLLDLNITSTFCGRDVDSSSDGRFKAAIGISIALLALVVLATIWDAFIREHWVKRRIHTDNSQTEKHIYEEIGSELDHKVSIGERCEMAFTGFSFYSNVSRIFRASDEDGHIPVLNGIRVLSFAYILFAHTYLFGPIYNECWVSGNLLTAIQWIMQSAIMQPILNASFNTDSFLLISGTLITYWWMIKYDEKNERLTVGGVVYYIVHRYWRLMPVMMLGMMIFTTLYKYLGDGPMFPPEIADAENCRDNWWPNLLMVNNYVNTSRTCLTWMWYPAVIFQLHVVTLVVLIPLAKKPIFGYVMIAVMYIAHIGATAGVLVRGFGKENFSWYWDYLVTPWCRAGSFAIGLTLGIILYKHRRNPRAFSYNLLWNLICWVVALALVFLVLFIGYTKNKEDGTEWSRHGEIAFDLLSRSAWALSLAWIVFSCHTGHGGIINSMLSYRFWWPLSKLTYSAFVLHSLVIFALAYGRRTLLHISFYHQLYRVIGHFWLAMLVGLLLACLFFYPISVGLERALVATTKRQWLETGVHPDSKVQDEQEPNSVQLDKMKVQPAGSTRDQGLSGTGYVPYAANSDKPPAYDETRRTGQSSSNSNNTVPSGGVTNTAFEESYETVKL